MCKYINAQNEEISGFTTIEKCFSVKCSSKALLEDWRGWGWCFFHWLIVLYEEKNIRWFFIKSTKLKVFKWKK